MIVQVIDFPGAKRWRSTMPKPRRRRGGPSQSPRLGQWNTRRCIRIGCGSRRRIELVPPLGAGFIVHRSLGRVQSRRPIWDDASCTAISTDCRKSSSSRTARASCCAPRPPASLVSSFRRLASPYRPTFRNSPSLLRSRPPNPVPTLHAVVAEATGVRRADNSQKSTRLSPKRCLSPV